jgi:hypothetical protein
MALPFALPLDEARWSLESAGDTVFAFDYDAGRAKLLALYEKGKRLQWNANDRIDWSHEIDPDDPLKAPEEYNPLFGTPIWDRLDEKARCEVRRHVASWQFSQFLHGEQGALLCASKIVTSVPDLDAKYYAATQVVDEARHVEVYSRYLREKIGFGYPVNPYLKTLLEQVLCDSRWDFTYLGMQILVEGLALAAFGVIRDNVGDPLAASINAYVMQDEARHVAFGRLALRDFYPQLTEPERAQREEFCVEACYLMRDRFVAEEVWDNLGLGPQAVEYVRTSASMLLFQKLLFSRIVPALREIGLWGTRVRRAFGDMDVLGFADIDLEALSALDEQKALELDAQRAQG